MQTLELVRHNALKALIPPQRISLGEWIEKPMRLPDSVSALPGKVRLWPPQRGNRWGDFRPFD